ncbi:hypothetical protein [Salinibacterium sp. ZJ454]|uniref:hypothetical protein n=1 Tax=Salinibacterium sp. ZJ454 TaxID=2708339 RepID=UPI001424875D|nr:hypothetical protein [Salinibacterium sp. ZJ454]
MSDKRLAQLGVFEIPIAALDGRGAPLASFLEPRRVDMPPGFAASGAPTLGWRVLPTSLNRAELREELIVLGAPVEDGQWFLGQLIERGGRWNFTFHGPIARHPSKAERSAGLQLRWPQAAVDMPVDQVFIDVLNTSTERWIPTPVDHFHTVGVLVEAGATTGMPRGYSYAYVSGQPITCVLDPGEYARVHVNVPGSAVIDAGLGLHALYAALPALNMTSELPLPVTITEEDLQKAAPPPPHRRTN